MALSPELIPVTNLLFSALIVIVGIMAWRKTKREAPLYIAAAFLLFGISHLATILGVADALAVPLIAIRIIGYILIIGMLYRMYAAWG
jgi:hydrogenase/urease accessory protein HupE